MKPKNFVIALLIGVAMSAGLFVSIQMNRPAEVTSALVLPAPRELPALSLLDQNGDAVSTDTFRGHWDLVFFGFTHCPDICPTTLQLLATVKRELQASGVTPLPRIVLVSVDPERDTPEILGQYIGFFGEDNLGITGSLDEIRVLTSSLGIFFEKNVSDDENYGVDHSSAVILIDPDARFAGLFSTPLLVDNFVHDLPIIMGHRQ